MEAKSKSVYPAMETDTVKIILLSFILVCFSYLLQGNIGINLADEGYLWYGALRTSLGDIPIRDFQSYDPGRYFWVAAWFKIFGSGIMLLRAVTAIFQFLGLTFGLLIVRRIISSWGMMICAGVILIVWMYPRHKLFEPSRGLRNKYFQKWITSK